MFPAILGKTNKKKKRQPPPLLLQNKKLDLGLGKLYLKFLWEENSWHLAAGLILNAKKASRREDKQD